MALQSEVSPPMVGDPKKDTQIDGDTKSDEDDTSQSSDEEIDLEEGEIVDSGAEEEKEKSDKDEKDKEEKDFTNSSLKDALDKSCLQNIEQMIKGGDDSPSPNRSKLSSPRKLSKRHGNYRDHDQTENSAEQNDNWFRGSPKKTKPESRPIDYRNELEAYRGTPPSSPDRKKRERRKRSSKKSKKSSRKTITRKDAKGQRVMRYKKDAARGKPCKYYKEGHCHKGADCPFSHISPESRFKKKELCKFYLSGHCNKGKHCVYMHKFPCKFHHTGSICYAKQDCRFSHDALTEEMKKVLADYLRQVHGDRDHHRDDFIGEEDREQERGPERERKRHHSQSPELPPHQADAPPPTKRVCLLGSPPRRIRESEETKRWQEEMKMLQQQNHPSFEINVMSDEEDMSAHFPKPNFYQETLLNSSPQQHPLQMDVPPPGHNPLVPPPGFNPPIFPPRMFNEGPPVHDNYPYEDEFQEGETPPIKQEPEDHFDWGEPHHMNDVKPNRNLEFGENSHQELDFTNDIKFDETTQFSEMESSADGPPALSPASALAQENKESESETSNPDSAKFTEKSADANNPAQEPPAPPIVAPSHLPRKQRELFMRVQQHNLPKENLPAIENTMSEVKKECEKEEKIEPKIEESNWYSSEEDDEDSDEVLTEKLKKIQQGPPPPKPVETKPPTSLMEMLNKIQQNTLEKKIASGNQKPNLLAPFLKGIFETVPAVPNTVTVLPATGIVPELKRRTLLPDPVLPPLSLSEPVVPKIVPKDPRLKNRDPRTLAALPTPINTTKRITDVNNIGNNSPTIDVNSLGPKPLSTVTNESPKDNVPYKLHGIYTRPRNYTPYLHASQSNPKLLNDPRLRKHLQPTPKVELPVGNGKDFEVIKTAPLKDAPPIPELLLKYEKPDSLINIFESNPPTKSPGNTQDSKHPLPMAAQRVCDPRMIRRDSRSNSGSDTPPHLTIVDTIKSPPHQEFKSAPVLENALKESVCEKKILPPVLEKSWTPPILEKSPPTVVIKKEPESDSESNYCPPKLEFSGKYSFKKSPSPEREFIAITKESPSHDDGTAPVVPPLIIKKIKPTLASHLPRAIADPRMAKLHNPMDPRRLRLASSEKSLVERKVQPTIQGLSKLAASGTPEDSSCASDISKSPSGERETVEKEEKPRTAKSIPKKRRLSDKSEDKKRTVHRNRKSSMDYASPLNSCDDAVMQKSSGYNSYNQRPKRSTHPLNDRSSNSSNLSSADSSDTSSIPNFIISDNSNNDCDNSSDGNLKDRFKTIDPTASPFC